MSSSLQLRVPLYLSFLINQLKTGTMASDKARRSFRHKPRRKQGKKLTEQSKPADHFEGYEPVFYLNSAAIEAS
jgi:hypothetical protein